MPPSALRDPILVAMAKKLGVAAPQDRPIDPYQIGINNSGAPTVVPANGNSVGVLRVEHNICDDTSGLCTVHLHAAPKLPSLAPYAGMPNGRLIAHVQWWAGQSGGRCFLDVTGGSIFTVAGTTAVQVDCQQVTSDESIALITGDDIIVQCQAAWLGQAAPPRPGFMTGLRQVVDGTQSVQSIPFHAQYVYLVSDDPTVSLDLLLMNLNGTSTRYSANFPPGVGAAGKVAIVGGVGKYLVRASKNCFVTAIFEMVI